MIEQRFIPLALGLLVLVLGGLTARPAVAQSAGQSAEAYFHRGAQAYIDEDFAQAEAHVEEGLRLDPSNEKLQALREKLQQDRQQQQSGSSSNNEQERSQPSDDQSGDTPQNEGEEEERPREEQQEQDEQGGAQQQEEPSEERSAEEEQSDAFGGDTEAGALPEDPQRLSREQAERILQALRDQEEQLLHQILQREERPRRVDKEW